MHGWRICRRRGDKGSGRSGARFAIPAMAIAGITMLVLSCGDGTVEPAPPPAPAATTLTVSPASVGLSALGETAKFTAEVRDQNGQVMTDAAVAWANSDASVVSVDLSGLVTAVANGSATITATAGPASGTASVTVEQAVDSVTVSPADDLTVVSAALWLDARAFDSNGHAVSHAVFEWSSSDEGVATVDSAGVVTAVSGGTVAITAQVGAASATAALTVLDVHEYLGRQTAVADAMLWRDTDGIVRPYPQWTETMKTKLTGATAKLFEGWSGLPQILPNQGSEVKIGCCYRTIHSAEDAEDMYAATVAHSLLLEMRGTVPWSLDDLSTDELALLFDSRPTYSDYGTFNGVTGYYAGWSAPAPPDYIWRFLEDEELIGATRKETLVNVLHWARYHLRHYYRTDATVERDEYFWNYRGGAPVARVLEGTTPQRPGDVPHFGHWTAGCHGTNRLLIHVLRVLNIPVEYALWGGHAVPVFPSEGVALTHGDDPYSQLAQYAEPFPEPFPTGEMLIATATYSEWFSESNTNEENLHNVGRRGTELGVEHLPQWLLRVRCDDIANGRSNAESRVYRPGTAGIGWYWSVAELEAMQFWQRMDAKIAQYGGCAKIPPPRYRGGDP